MPTSPKRPDKPTAPPRAKRLVKASPPSAKPFLRFYHSESLRAKTLAVLTTLEKAKDSTQHRNALADIVVELTDSGMDYYFMRPLKLAKVGFFVEQSANLGLGATKRVFGSVIRNIIGRMDNPQLRSVCSSIRQMMK
ncbi:MAG: hypothetical protein ABSH32_13730 [Bryobacteraceae bacterium]